MTLKEQFCLFVLKVLRKARREGVGGIKRKRHISFAALQKFPAAMHQLR